VFPLLVARQASLRVVYGAKHCRLPLRVEVMLKACPCHITCIQVSHAEEAATSFLDHARLHFILKIIDFSQILPRQYT
jgi:hypothetical protein